MAGFVTRALFHCVVAVLAGLVDWEAVISNLVLAYVVYTSVIGTDGTGFAGTCVTQAGNDEAVLCPAVGVCDSLPVLGASLACMLFSEQWAQWVQRRESIAVKLALFDASDLLMCWWDSPYMRMYSWEVETYTPVPPPPRMEASNARSANVFAFPVTLFSPYDTLITVP